VSAAQHSSESSVRICSRENRGVSFYRQQVLPRVTNMTLARGEYEPIRRRVAAGLAGEVLEVGFGSGLNVPHYPPGVTRVLAVDPAIVGRKLAAERIACSRVTVEFTGPDGQDLPVPSASVDHVLSTWTMCSIPNVAAALGEMRRVLRPGGELHFAEHGRSPDPGVSAWQDRLTPLQRLMLGGCHLNRPIELLIAHAGFSIITVRNYYLKGPRPMKYIYEGVATPS
jgi:ubiquinone/menaquinone biosynthesis C-methylase UbiE